MTKAPETILGSARARVATIDSYISEREGAISHLEKLLAADRRALVAWRNERAQLVKFLRENASAA